MILDFRGVRPYKPKGFVKMMRRFRRLAAERARLSPLTPSNAAPALRPRARASRPRRAAESASGGGEDDGTDHRPDVASLPSPDRENLADAFADLLADLIREGRLPLTSDIRRTEVVSSSYGPHTTEDRPTHHGP